MKCIGLAVFIAVLGIVGRIEYNDQKMLEQVIRTEREIEIARVLTKAGSDAPDALAKELAKAKRPRLATAVAVVETRGRNVRGAVNEKGYFQIREELHGAFNDDIPSQVKKFEDVIEPMIRKSDGVLEQALCRYNGDFSGAYAGKVLKVVERVRI